MLDRLSAITGQTPGIWSHIELHNFYGIELSDFAAETAKLSLWIAKFQMDRAHKDVFGTAPPALPLSDSGKIVRDNALRVDWMEVCPPAMITRNRQKIFDLATIIDVHGTETVVDNNAETFIVGNPPYLGARLMTAAQKSDLGIVASIAGSSWRVLDYVAGWFIKAANYMRSVPKSAAALVSTNSLCQGQQVPVLWPCILKDGIEISFAHTSFKWTNNAAGEAAVICVIIGISQEAPEYRYLFTSNVRQKVGVINPYLAGSPTIYIEPSRQPANGMPPMLFGNMPRDGGALILASDERSDLLRAHPEAARWVKPFIGSREAINGLCRFCLWIPDVDRAAAEAVPPIRARLDKVREMRMESDAASTKNAALFPHRFVQIQGSATAHSIIVPAVSSERRRYLPVDYLDSDAIVSNSAFALYDAPVWTISLIASRLHLLWIEAVCGKLKSDFRYSNTIGWHTFPVPSLTTPDRDRLTECAETILLVRAEIGGTLADLYDPDGMPEALKEAHNLNDQIVEEIYSARTFRSDADRLNHLFRRYARKFAIDRGDDMSEEFDLEDGRNA